MRTSSSSRRRCSASRSARRLFNRSSSSFASCRRRASRRCDSASDRPCLRSFSFFLCQRNCWSRFTSWKGLSVALYTLSSATRRASSSSRARRFSAFRAFRSSDFSRLRLIRMSDIPEADTEVDGDVLLLVSFRTFTPVSSPMGLLVTIPIAALTSMSIPAVPVVVVVVAPARVLATVLVARPSPGRPGPVTVSGTFSVTPIRRRRA